jgi:predicted nucleic-acid-binding Zn-ribbon protein
MKTTHVCPKCSGTKLFVVPQVRQPDPDSSNGTLPMHVLAVNAPSDVIGVPEGNSYRAVIGTFEAWICGGCGYTEWYAQDAARYLELLAEYEKHSTVKSVIIVAPPPPSPFR